MTLRQTDNRRLLVITQSYPFGERTDFLEDEIDDLTNSFDEVVLVPLDPQGRVQQLPEGTSLDLTLSEQIGRRQQLTCALSPHSLLFSRLEWGTPAGWSQSTIRCSPVRRSRRSGWLGLANAWGSTR